VSAAARLRTAALCAALACSACALLALAGPALGAQTHGFDATLSLTGSCAESPEDPVPDPAEPPCPATGEGLHPPAIWSCAEEAGCSSAFTAPKSIATDEYGNVYVASRGLNAAGGDEGRIDVFDSEGFFVTEVPDEAGPLSVAVDSEGNLYVSESHVGGPHQVRRFPPSLYEPAAGKIEYANAPVVVSESGSGIAIDRANDNLFIDHGSSITELGSAAEGNPVLDESIGVGSLPGGESIYASKWVAVDAARKLIYVSAADDASGPDGAFKHSRVRVFELEAPHALVRTIDGSSTPEGEFKSNGGRVSIAVDEATGHVFVDDMARTSRVYEFTETGEYVSTITHSFSYVYLSEISIDNGRHSPNSSMNPESAISEEENPNGSYLFVPSKETGVGHSYAFAPLVEGPPEVEELSFTGATESEAQLRAKVNPDGAATHYRFQITPQATYEAQGFEGAQLAGEGDVPAGTLGVGVSAVAAGLSPGTAYRFRVVAENEYGEPPVTGEDEAQATLSTYPAVALPPTCPNQALRTGLSALLPDCRAYELASPPDTGGRAPYGPENSGAGDHFGTATASPDGSSLAFMTIGGAIPGTEGAGGFNGSSYLATRTAGGWSLESIGLSGAQSSNPLPGGLSPEHSYGVNTATEAGSLPLEGKDTRYLRAPDGSFALLGQGSIGADPVARALFLAPNGAHAIFMTGGTGSSAPRLEPSSPPAGTAAIYDRTPDGTLHVVSLLPGDVTPGAGEGTLNGPFNGYKGASAQGNAVAFKLGSDSTSPLYLRLGDERTLEAAAPGATFAGLSAEGRYAFYLQGGDLYRYDTASEAATQLTETADATVVNVPAQGTSAYFVSESAIPGAGANPHGAEAQAGEANLYRWSGGATSFVATVSERDVEGEFTGGNQTDGLGLWVAALSNGGAARDPSRASADGAVLLFESRADLTGYDPQGHAEVYRYSAAEGTLACLSCNPTGQAASSDASLQSVSRLGSVNSPEPTGGLALIPNLATNGARALFESSEALVAADTDGVQDVYEWEAQGQGSCTTPGGCVNLISSGQSARDNYLYGASDSGNDVFVSTSDLLVGADRDETPSIYDARVEGGFAEAAEEGCEGEACKPPPTPAPFAIGPQSLPTPIPNSGPSANLTPHDNCAAPARRAHRLARAAKRLRRRAKASAHRAHRLAGRNPRAAKRLRRRAHRLATVAKRRSSAARKLSRRAKRCRRSRR
jgi:hypothetical protein